MARRMVWTEPALEDLEAMAAYIARDSLRYAAAVVFRAVAESYPRSVTRMSVRFSSESFV